MPYAPRRGCAYGNCKERVAPGSRYCEEHKKQADREYNLYERPPGYAKRYGQAWRKVRERYAKEHPLCERCLDEGRLTLMDEVHHIVPVSRGGTNDEANLMSLCHSCHTKIHHELGDR